VAISKQEYWTKLVETSKNGGFPAAEAGCCHYLTADNKKCGVGILFPDGTYERTKHRNCGAENFLNMYPEFAQYIPEGMTGRDLVDVQETHDDTWRSLRKKGLDWNHDCFVQRLRGLPCFADIAS